MKVEAPRVRVASSRSSASEGTSRLSIKNNQARKKWTLGTHVLTKILEGVSALELEGSRNKKRRDSRR
jgi:hypothetical protein